MNEVFAEEAYKSLKRSASAPLSKVVPAINRDFNIILLSQLSSWRWRWPTWTRAFITETELKNVKHNAVKVLLYAGNNGSSSDILRCKDLPKQLKIVSVIINQS